MPGVASDPRSRILEGFELESLGGNSDAASIREEALSVSRHEVREPPSFPEVSMEPEPAIHGVDHSVATEPEFAKGRLVRSVEIPRRPRVMGAAHCLTSEAALARAGRAQLQAIEPSTVAGDTALTEP